MRTTPGPWYFAAINPEGCSVIGNHDGKTVANVWVVRESGFDMRSRDEREAEARANARLIAAAPTLRDALQKIDANAAESVEWIRRVARAALAAAEGGK